MMREVEAGNVEYLCIKDMSRMGRDYLKVGQIMEILRQRGVRLIAINDGVDSARGDDDFTPFRNIMNEYYARDTSRKIRSTFQSKGKSGKHLTGTVIYGYLWNEARDQWLVDPEAAEVVKRIFAMTIEGYGPYQIASKLKSEKVLIPSAYLAQHGEGVNKNKTFKDVYGWGSSTICNILEKREYLGHTINFKTRKHFKDKKSHYVPEDEWTIFENTHEPIIDQQTFDLVQKIRGNVRRYPDGWGEAAPLTGLLYCADCGGKMYVHRTNNGKRISQYTCSQYSKVPVGKLCTTQHRINEDVVLSLVSEMLKASHSLPALSFKDHPNGTTEFREHPTYAFQIDHGHSSHVRQGDELVQISADGLQLLQHFFQAVDDHHLLSQAAGSDVVAHGHPGLLRQLLDGLPVCGRHAGAEFNIFFHVVSSKS